MTLIVSALSAALVAFVQIVEIAHAAPARHEVKVQGTYDFIVVGGGTAGNAVAARLGQRMPESTILVIEAGLSAPDEDRINIPGLKGSTLGTKYDWNFTSIPQPQLNDRVITQSRGKVLGGTSAINLMIWDRGSKAEYDAWEELGNPGWDWNHMIAAMIKAENFSSYDREDYTGITGFGVEGPINAVVNKYIPAHQDTWLPTFANLHVDQNTAWLGGENVGAAYHSSTIDPSNYTRSYSAVEYLHIAGSNVRVATGAEVAKINIDEGDGDYVATGVTLINGTVIMACREVIISAGTLKSPPLLEQSGIGNASLLQKAGVEVFVELPGVGENLQDHPRIQAAYQLKDNYTSFDRLKYDAEYAAEQRKLYDTNQLSAYDYAASAYSYQNWSSILGQDKESELVGKAKRVAAEYNSVVDNKKLQWLTDSNLSASVAEAEFLLSDGYSGLKGYPKPADPLYGKGFTTVFAALMHPLARGYVHINSSNPTAKLIYDPAFASNEYDLKALVELSKYIRRIATTAPFSSLWVDEYEPGLDVDSDEEWENFVKDNVNTFYHPVGTCAMLPRKDGGVVDSELKVYGTRNLRVVDASVIPVLVSAHPQTGIYGIAERAAMLISGSW
jgi:choline dehydrogenase-like flavoprotein